MEPLYILFVCAGGVFVVLLLALMLASIEGWRRNSDIRKELSKTYGDKNIAKMEYDIAFYDGDLYARGSRSDSAKQVTFDDVFGGDEDEGEEDELSRFKPIGETHSNVVVGHYDPETSNE